MDSMAKSILQIRRGKNYTSRNFTRDVSLSLRRREICCLEGWKREGERERVGFTLNGTCFSWVNSRLFLSVVISYKGFALGNLYSNLKKILFIGFFFCLIFLFFLDNWYYCRGWIVSCLRRDKFNCNCNSFQQGCFLVTFQSFVKVFDKYSKCNCI